MTNHNCPKLALLIPTIFLTLLFAVGCAFNLAEGPYAGNKILFTADKIITESYETVDAFLKWEHDGRKTLAVSNPAITRFADNLRDEFPKLHKELQILREVYKLNPTEENRHKLEQSLGLVKALLTAIATHLPAS